MGDWTATATYRGSPGPIGPFSDNSVVAQVEAFEQGGSGLASGTFPVANLAIFAPVYVTRAVTVYGFAWFNGATVSGNVDCGMFDKEGAYLSSVGSTAQAGTSVIQSASVTSFSIVAGLYYVALACDNTTATFTGLTSLTAQLGRTAGLAQQTTAFPLPTGGATYAAFAQTRLPAFAAFTEGSTF